jgi:DNA (cytosine-5)-methyltransferase 1
MAASLWPDEVPLGGHGVIYGSVCSGIEAATVAWHPLGWRSAFFAEVDPFPSAVLAHHYPDTPNLGDFTQIGGWHVPIDVLVGGTPCQSFSVAGRRLGMDDPRGNLALEFLALARRLRPRWLVFENVPGLLSSDEGRDFGAFLGLMGECGYGFAYRVLDAQFVRVECHPRAVPQRRRRLFVVGYLGDWRPAAAVLLEPEGMRGDPAPRRKEGKGITDGAVSRALVGSRDDQGANKGASLITSGLDEGHVARVLCRTAAGRYDPNGETFVTHSLRADGFDASEDGTGRGIPLVADPITTNEQKTYTHEGSTFRLRNVVGLAQNQRGELRTSDVSSQLTTGGGKPGEGYPCVAFQSSQSGMREVEAHATLDANNGSRRHNGIMYQSAGGVVSEQGDICPTLDSARESRGPNQQRSLGTAAAVRRLTPRECERLQGFPEIRKSLRVQICEDVKIEAAKSAALNSQAQNHEASEHAHWHVQIDLERTAVEISKAGRCLWSASDAARRSSSPLHMPLADFVLLVATMTTTPESAVRNGREASPQSIKPSSAHRSGSASVRLYGCEINALAADAVAFTSALNQCSRFTTSLFGHGPPISAAILQTLSCCAVAAIASFIPSETMRGSSYAVTFETTHGYTLVRYRGKPAADGPRYKALGNSMAVNCMRWIGERIALFERMVV